VWWGTFDGGRAAPSDNCWRVGRQRGVQRVVAWLAVVMRSCGQRLIPRVAPCIGRSAYLFPAAYALSADTTDTANAVRDDTPRLRMALAT
jgi:hypothetical protein